MEKSKKRRKRRGSPQSFFAGDKQEEGQRKHYTRHHFSQCKLHPSPKLQAVANGMDQRDLSTLFSDRTV